MFESLISFWKGKDFLIQVFEEFKHMLNDSQAMFEAVIKRLIAGEDVPDLREKIYALDLKVNCLEKDIRSRIAKHLLLQPSVDVTACLLLMSVVKDAERLGDYCKNLYEVSELANGPINKKKYEELFGSMEQDIATLFHETKQAFIESNEDKAIASWTSKSKIGKGCDAIIVKIAKSDLSANDAVCFTLIARHFKRLTSHLTNIASSVVLPISELDYFDEKRKKK